MARIRSIRPEFCTSHDINVLSIPCRLHYVMLWTYADDSGRGVDDPKIIKGQLWPLDDQVTPEQVEIWQDELHRHGRIMRYVVAGRRYFEVVNFTVFQRPNRPVPSKLPESSGAEQCLSSEDSLFAHNQLTPVVVVVGGDVDGEQPASDAREDSPVEKSEMVDKIKALRGVG